MTDEVVDEGPGESVDLAEEVIEETVAEVEDAEAEDAEAAARNLSRDESARMRRLLAGWYAAAGRIAALDGDQQEAEALLSRGAAVDKSASSSTAPPPTAAGEGH